MGVGGRNHGGVDAVRTRTKLRGSPGDDGGSRSGNRFRKPSWREPRLLIGLGLVAAAVAGTVATVALTNSTQSYVVAAHDLEVGTRVTAEDLRTVNVRLDGAERQYVPDAEHLSEGAVIVDRVSGGQLVPIQSVGTTEDLDRRPIGIPLNAPLPNNTGAGDTVDVWVSDRENNGRGWSEPRQILRNVELSSVDQSAQSFGATQQVSVNVLVHEPDVAAVVDALATESRITVVPHMGGGQ